MPGWQSTLDQVQLVSSTASTITTLDQVRPAWQHHHLDQAQPAWQHHHLDQVQLVASMASTITKNEVLPSLSPMRVIRTASKR